MSLLGAGAMGVYIDYPILRGHSVCHQDMDITCYDSMVGLMKDVSNGLWDGGFCVIKGSCDFFLTPPLVCSLKVQTYISWE